MRRLALLGLIVLLNLVPASKAEVDSLPICTSDEFLEIFSLIVEHQVKVDESFASFSDLLDYGGAQIVNRERSLTQLPYCSDAVAIRRLFIQLGGDTVARAALELATLPAGENPYRLRLPSDHDRVTELAATMLGVDRSQAPAPAERSLPACLSTDMQLLDKTIGSFLNLLAATATVVDRAHYVVSVDRRLQWREDKLPNLPDCAESVELSLRLSETATDAAARHALAYAGVSDETNPYVKLEADGVALLRAWHEQIQIIRASASSVGGSLPPCTIDESTAAYQILLPYPELSARAAAIRTTFSLLNFSEGLIAYRENQLSQLPLCAETFNAGWWVGEVLNDLTAHAASSLTTTAAGAISRNTDRVEQNAAKAEAGLARIKRILDGEQRLLASALGGAASCSDSERIFFGSYIMPEFRNFLDAALAVSSANEVGALATSSANLRDLLWLHLPRCIETLEYGRRMRGIAADFSAMLALEGAGVPIQDIPYTRAVAVNIESLFERFEQANEDRLIASANTYYVVAETIANVRSCGSTECVVVATLRHGDALDVLDDAGAWYEIYLDDGQTAYIAGFLASKTKP